MVELPSAEMSGFITIHKGVDPDNIEYTSSFPNMILDTGLREFGINTTYLKYCNVGSSGAAVSANQTGLQNKLYHSDTNQGAEQVGVNQDDPVNPFIYRRLTKRFPPKGVAYNVAEVGFGWNTENSCFNRALVLDGSGAPVAISVQGNEYLDVTYEVRLYPPMQDTTGVVIPSGVDTSPRTWTARAAGGSGGTLSYNTSSGWSLGGGYVSGQSTSRPSAHATSLSEVFAIPAGRIGLGGTSGGIMDSTGAGATYSISFPLNEANSTFGVRSVSKPTLGPYFQIEFDPPFMKTDENELTISFRHSWGRR